MRDPKIAYLQVRGFRNNYSTTAQEEDKAEIWAALITINKYQNTDDLII